jgi:POT family proton-dependent oligopeptide transporter
MQAEADNKPHLYGATLNHADVGVPIEKDIVDHSSAASSAHVVEEDGIGGIKPTAEELKTLRRVGEPLPKSAFLVAIVELCERFTCMSDPSTTCM